MIILNININNIRKSKTISMLCCVKAATESVGYTKYLTNKSVPLAYFKSSENQSDKNIYIQDLSWRVPENNENLINSESIEYLESLNFSSIYKEILITNKFYTDSQGASVPLFYRHKTKFMEEPMISATKKGTLKSEGSFIYSNGYLYSNESNIVENDNYIIWNIAGKDIKNNSVNEIYNPVACISEANENLKLISTSPITDSWDQQARFFEFQINTEDTLIEIDRKVNLLPLDNGDDLFGILGNSHFCFNLDAMGYLCKKRIYIKKDANKLPINLDNFDFTTLTIRENTNTNLIVPNLLFFTAYQVFSDAHAYNIINYSIKLAGRKFINFKLNCYTTTSNSTTQVLSRIDTREVVYSSDIDNIDFLELTKQALIPDYDDTNQYDLIKSVLIYHYLNDIDFKVEIIEDFDDFIINITGSCFDWKPLSFPYL